MSKTNTLYNYEDTKHKDTRTMGFLLGAFGKLAAGRRVRQLQAKMMRVQSRLRRATRQIETTSKMIETQKKYALNSLTMQSSMANQLMPGMIMNQMGIDQSLFNKFMGYGGLNNGTGLTDDEKLKFGEFQNLQNQFKMNNEMANKKKKQQIEEYCENLNDMLLEPLKMEEDSLQTEKDSLESQIQIAQADYEACKKMEQADAKNLAPNYTGAA